jgi:hypothetical protein
MSAEAFNEQKLPRPDLLLVKFLGALPIIVCVLCFLFIRNAFGKGDVNLMEGEGKMLLLLLSLKGAGLLDAL